MKKKHLLILCALILCLSFLLNGCMSLLMLSELGDALTDLTSGSFENYTSYEDYPRPTSEYCDPVSFSEITYSRPDADALRKGFEAIQVMVEEEESSDDVLDAFMPLYEDYVYFYTLSNYAYIRYCLNLSDSYYDTEYNWCEEQSPLIEQAMEKCYIAMAKSSLRDDLEDDYFGEGFFEYYDENQIYSNDRVVELMQEESALEAEYMALQNEMTIRWNGKECLVEDLLSDDDLSYDEYLNVYRLYYEKYNPLATEIFVKMVKIRKEMAEELEYESFAHFAYEHYYDRDYTPEQVESYTNDIATYLSDYYYTALYSSYSYPMDNDEVMEELDNIAHSFGGEIALAYDFMEAYDLYDISSSANKMPGSFVTYLSAYDMPYMYISPTEDIADLLTATHEFGHFVDDYVNCNQTYSVDCAEVFSQGLEYLAINKSGLTSYQKRSLTVSKLSDSLLTFLSQGCYSEFEQSVYELPEEDLNAETINALFLECNEKFGMGSPEIDDVIAPGWIDIQHFFIAPYYVISYCISNDAALQIYEIEDSQGSGLDAYYDLLHLSANNTILSMLEEANMGSPFEPGRMKELAAFFENSLD